MDCLDYYILWMGGSWEKKKRQEIRCGKEEVKTITKTASSNEKK